MKKRTFCMLILALVLISLFAIGASADYDGPISVVYTEPTAGTSTESFRENIVLTQESSEIEINNVYIIGENEKIESTFAEEKTYTCFLLFKCKSGNFITFSKDKETNSYTEIFANGEKLGFGKPLSSPIAVTENGWLEFNGADGDAPFIYKSFLISVEDSGETTEDPGEQEDPESPAIPENDRFKEVNISIAEDLAMTFYYTPEKGELYTDYRTQATLQLADGGEVSAELSPRDKDGKKAFTFTGIAPQCMCDELTQILQGKKEDGTWEDIAQMSCSVREYCDKLLKGHESEKKLCDLVYDLLAYGSAVQTHRDYNTENPADAGCSGEAFRTEFPHNYPPKDKAGSTFVSKKDGERFYGATLVLNNVNFICFVLDLDTSQHSDYSVEIEYGSYKNTIPFSELEKDLDGHYRCYSPAISLCANDNEHGNVRASLFSKGIFVDDVDYWVNCYVASKWKSSDKNLSDLVMRLYCLGKSAREYLS